MELEQYPEPGSGWPIFELRGKPLFVDGPGSEDWHCRCGALIANNVYDRQAVGILIRCYSCGNLMKSPEWVAGQVIPGIHLCANPDLVWHLDEPLTVSITALVGRGALLNYARETGKRIEGVFEPRFDRALTELTSDSFNKLAAKLRILLGDSLKAIQESDIRGQESKTPPPYRHRMIELIEYVQSCSELFEDFSSERDYELDGSLLSESVTVIEVAQRWQNHPAWPALRETFADALTGQHTVMTLLVASALADFGNGVGIHVEPLHQNTNIADLWVEPDLSERVDVEVKTPIALRSPTTELTESDAKTLIERSLSKSKNQRKNTRSNILVIGGYNLGDSLDVLLAAANSMMIPNRGKWKSVVGVLFVDSTYNTSLVGSQRAFGVVARIRFAQHPRYEGGLKVRRGPGLDG